MEISFIYIISQIITVIYFGFLSLSYLLKNREHILLANLLAHIGQMIAMGMLNGATGAAMAFIMMLRDLVFLIQEKKHIKKSELHILIVTIILIIVLTSYTYKGPISLLSVGATLCTTFALWQKNVKRYKLMGIMAGILWLAYNIFIASILGIILQTILNICSIIGFYRDNKNIINKMNDATSHS